MSTFKLHRLFTESTGTTPGRYVERRRLDTAALMLAMESGRITEIAYRCGYRNHETFTRAFRRRFGCSPTRFRQAARWAGSGPPPLRTTDGEAYALSATRATRLNTIHIARVRHHGAYEAVPDTLWQTLTRSLRVRGVPWGRFLGIGHDDPRVTPAHALRFDAAVQVTHALGASGTVVAGRIPAGDYAVTAHVGAYGSLARAMPVIVAQARELEGFDLIGLPVVEVYHAAEMDAGAAVACTDVYLPIRRRTGRGAAPAADGGRTPAV